MSATPTSTAGPPPVRPDLRAAVHGWLALALLAAFPPVGAMGFGAVDMGGDPAYGDGLTTVAIACMLAFVTHLLAWLGARLPWRSTRAVATALLVAWGGHLLSGAWAGASSERAGAVLAVTMAALGLEAVAVAAIGIIASRGSRLA